MNGTNQRCQLQERHCNDVMPADAASQDDWQGIKKTDVTSADSCESPMQPKKGLTRRQSFTERFNRNARRQLKSVNSVPNGRCLRYLAYKYIPKSQSSFAITSELTTNCECTQDKHKRVLPSPVTFTKQDTCCPTCAKEIPYQDRPRCPRLFNRDGTPVVRRRPKSTNGPPQLRYQQQTPHRRNQRGRPHSSYEPQRQHLEEVTTTETLDVICTYLKEVRLDKATKTETSVSELNQPDAMKYTREKWIYLFLAPFRATVVPRKEIAFLHFQGYICDASASNSLIAKM
ncbi:hypothetical protein CAPTEDRAFT_194130 [Capitella teleta]|uniref:Uncharacterized protein n=1 Tax=Capitella teleta TaxID=283909 RepID=R7TI71_CAPTE|nr:hypothetical protein CAPTEDRAFT_194130 [Capitella teleta]|eukprot:ELT93528.1 hypothetical protein CAPTEDRAFT_194130 [Capitella teleta]